MSRRPPMTNVFTNRPITPAPGSPMDVFLKKRANGEYPFLDTMTREEIHAGAARWMYGDDPSKYPPCVNSPQYTRRTYPISHFLVYGIVAPRNPQIGEVPLQIAAPPNNEEPSVGVPVQSEPLPPSSPAKMPSVEDEPMDQDTLPATPQSMGRDISVDETPSSTTTSESGRNRASRGRSNLARNMKALATGLRISSRRRERRSSARRQ